MPRKKKTEVNVELDSLKSIIPFSKSATVNEMAGCVIGNKTLVAQLEAMGFKSKNPGGMTFKEAIIASQIGNAMKGDIQAYRAVMDYAEKDTESSPLIDFVQANFEGIEDEF